MDTAGNAYVTGEGAFVAKFNSSGSQLVYLNYLGGCRGEVEIALTVNGVPANRVTINIK